MSITRKPRIETIRDLSDLPPGQSAVLDDGASLPRLVHRREDGSVPQTAEAAALADTQRRVAALEEPGYSARTMEAAYWPEYSVALERFTWTRLQKDGVDQPGLVVPALPPARPGRRWEAQIEGFLRLGATKPGTVYVGIQATTMGGVSGGKLFTAAGDDLIPVIQRLPVGGGEKIYFSLYATAEGGSTIFITPNPFPYLLIREVMA